MHTCTKIDAYTIADTLTHALSTFPISADQLLHQVTQCESQIVSQSVALKRKWYLTPHTLTPNSLNGVCHIRWVGETQFV